MGDHGDDVALSVFFADTKEQMWFAPHLVEFVNYNAGQTMSLEGGPSLTRDAEGTWHEVGGSTAPRDRLKLGSSDPDRVSNPFGRIRRWLDKGPR
jgi:hypothetical protein